MKYFIILALLALVGCQTQNINCYNEKILFDNSIKNELDKNNSDYITVVATLVNYSKDTRGISNEGGTFYELQVKGIKSEYTIYTTHKYKYTERGKWIYYGPEITESDIGKDIRFEINLSKAHTILGKAYYSAEKYNFTSCTN